MRALSIREPYAAEILLGTKTVAYRTRPTRMIGERFYIYASRSEPTENDLWDFSGIFESQE